jgi:hypothetical protein
MKAKIWLAVMVGLIICSIFLAGCATTGPTASGTQQYAKYDNRFDPAGWLNPNSPSFWIDYQNVYGGGCR